MRASAIYPKKFHTDDLNRPLLMSYNYNDMHVKPNKIKFVGRPITNPTSAWHVYYDLYSLGFS